MSGIYTRRGDGGETSLSDGTRVGKDDLRIEALGDLDEANCAIGLARPAVIDNHLDAMLEFVQHRLFNCSAAVAATRSGTSAAPVTADDVAALEREIDRYDAKVGPMRGFVLPGCDEASSRMHLARATVRRAERSLVRASREIAVDPAVLAFVNRASDFLFVAARYLGAGDECTWRADAEPPGP